MTFQTKPTPLPGNHSKPQALLPFLSYKHQTFNPDLFVCICRWQGWWRARQRGKSKGRRWRAHSPIRSSGSCQRISERLKIALRLLPILELLSESIRDMTHSYLTSPCIRQHCLLPIRELLSESSGAVWGSLVQCVVAVCCSVQCVAVCRVFLQCVVAVYCIVQCVAMCCCSVSQCSRMLFWARPTPSTTCTSFQRYYDVGRSQFLWYRVAKTHRMPYLIDHFPQISH